MATDDETLEGLRRLPVAPVGSVFSVNGHPASAADYFFSKRELFLGPVTDESALDLVQNMRALADADPRAEITININSPGGSVVAGNEILATMDEMPYDIKVVCRGQAASMGALIFAHGTPGKRFIAPNSRVLIHQPRGGGSFSGLATNQEVSAAEIMRLFEQSAAYLASDTGQALNDVMNDMKEDLWLNADQAIEYGLADHKTKIARPGIAKEGINPPSKRAAEVLAERKSRGMGQQLAA